MRTSADPTALDYRSTERQADGRWGMGKGVIVLTYGCNMKCSFCYAGAEVFGRPRSMSLTEAKKSVDFLESLGVRTFTLLGGEPTVFKHLHALVDYSRRKSMGPWIVSNGDRLADADYTSRLMAAGLKGGCISFHGGDAATHDAAVCVPGSFARATQALELATEHGWPLFPMLTVMKPNFETVSQTVRYLRTKGARTIYINYGIPNIVAELDTDADVLPAVLARMTQELYIAQAALDVKFIFNREKNKIPLCHFDYEILKDMLEEEQIGTGCEAVQGNTVVIEPGGNVLGCSHWVEHPLLNIYANFDTLELIDQKTFWRLWSGGKPYAFRQDLRFYPYEKCSDCGWRKAGKCFGGCKVWQSAGVLAKAIDLGPVP
jgi:radical SAM protein with 4Fe4S-binding SPASM domain